MKKYTIKFQRDFVVEVGAENLTAVERLSRDLVAGFPADTCKLLSIIAEDAVVEHTAPDIKPPTSPLGRPPTRPTPGTPTIRQDVLVDAIAKAA